MTQKKDGKGWQFYIYENLHNYINIPDFKLYEKIYLISQQIYNCCNLISHLHFFLLHHHFSLSGPIRVRLFHFIAHHFWSKNKGGSQLTCLRQQTGIRSMVPSRSRKKLTSSCSPLNL